MIHICYGLYDKDGRYSKFVGTSITSIFENTNSDVTIHILHDNTLSEENRDKFFYLAGHYSQTIKFYNVEKLIPEKIVELREKLGAVEKTKFSIGTLYRLLIPNIFSQEISKVIYLDADTIVNLDIKELWQIELGEKILGAVAEEENYISPGLYLGLCLDGFVKGEDYFNAGVLVINVKSFAKETEKLYSGMDFIAQNPKYDLFDQDLLNYCFTSDILKLPRKFNRFVNEPKKGNLQTEQRNYNTPIKPEIYHYIENTLNLDTRDAFNKLWFEYFSKTPWFNFDVINNIYSGIKQLYIEQKNFAVQVSKFVAGKNRVFFVEKNYIDAVKNIFGVKENEEIIPATDFDSLKKLIQSMNENRGKKVFFILVGNFQIVFYYLVQNKFIPEQDFVNALEFLSDAHGVPLDSYPIIKSL